MQGGRGKYSRRLYRSGRVPERRVLSGVELDTARKAEVTVGVRGGDNEKSRAYADKVKARGGGENALSFDELEDLVSGERSVEREHERRELIEEINVFLHKLPEKRRRLFICRYWWCYSVSEIAERFGMTESNVTVTLTRVRKKLKEYLIDRGYGI